MTSENLQDVVSEAQIFQIQQQILGYKALIRTTNIPRDVEKNMFSLSKDQWDVEKERLLQRTVKYYHEKVEKNDELKKLIRRYNNKKSVQLNDDQESDAPKPDMDSKDMDIEGVRKDTLVERRKNEISKFIQSGCLTDQAVTKLKIEGKFLNNLPFYCELRDHVLRKFEEDEPHYGLKKALLNRRTHTRERPSRKYEHRMMEKIENQMKSEQEFRKKVRSREFIQMLFGHQANFFEHHKRMSKIVKKRGLNVKNYLVLMEKRGINITYCTI